MTTLALAIVIVFCIGSCELPTKSRRRPDGIGGKFIIAANSGGAFPPIGDVTTIMLWNKGGITAPGVISERLVPAVVSMVISAYLLSLSLKGH